MYLLSVNENAEHQYMAYLLYDLLSSDSDSGPIDNNYQKVLFDSLPWILKKQ